MELSSLITNKIQNLILFVIGMIPFVIGVEKSIISKNKTVKLLKFLPIS